MAVPWRIELLGGLRVQHGARSITHFPKQKAGALLAYLAYYAHHSHPRDALVDVLWPEVDPEAGRNSLRNVLHALRHLLEPAGTAAGDLVIARRGTIGLDPAAFSTDVVDWHAALQAARQAGSLSERALRLIRAVDLYRGELLPGFYEDWILTQRPLLAEEHLGVLHQLVSLLEHAGDRERALEYARRAVSADPLREEAQYDLMRLYAAAGRPSAALRQYHELERLLREELGESPSAATRALADELRCDARTVVVARRGRVGRSPLALESPPSSPTERTASFAGGDPHEAVASVEPLPSTGSGPAGGGGASRRAATAPGAGPRAGADRSARPSAATAAPFTVVEAPALPPQLTRFFGREDEIAWVVEALRGGTRLVTLTGPGGSGKTRLAIAAAGRLAEAFGGAVGFVSLADVVPPASPKADEGSLRRRILDAVADTLGLGRSLHVDPLEQVVEALRARPWLLVLDNVEHLVAEAAPLVRALLERVAMLTVLVTSRQRLGIDGEQEFALLPLPTPRRSDPPGRLLEYASVQLFVDRARAVRPEFQMTEANAAAVAQLCDRLEGLPLALELAAARAQVLSPTQMLDHLERRFDFLVSRRRDAAARHRTLRAALDGSYQLLSPELRQFFARLSVFRGGWTLEAAEQVCAGDGPPSAPPLASPRLRSAPAPCAGVGQRSAVEGRGMALDALEQLRECSLIVAEEQGEELRYGLLETLREYAAEQLAPEDEAAVRRRHALFFLSLAEQMDVPRPGARSRTAVERLEREHLNLRAALAWSLADESNAELGLRLICRFRLLWHKHVTEGREWLATAVTRVRQTSPALRAEAFQLAGKLAGLQNDLTAAGAALKESLALWRAAGDRAGIADVLIDLAFWARGREEFDTAKALLEESVALRRELDDRPGVGWALENLAWTVRERGETALAHTLLQESLAIGRECGSPEIVAYTLHGLGWLSALQGDLAGARSLLEESLEAAREVARQSGEVSSPSALRRLWRELDLDDARLLLEQSLAFSRILGHQWMALHQLGALGHVAREQGDYERCAAYYRESLALRREGGDRFTIVQSLEDFAGLAGRQAQHERAIRLLGAADALCQGLGQRLPVAVPDEYERTIRRARGALEESAFAAAWEAGRAMPLDEAIAYALAFAPPATDRQPTFPEV
jgi:predicted ATPase/DNA-binding SARP family transcriptional activator